jgi:uncharacterized caspase-like protein
VAYATSPGKLARDDGVYAHHFSTFMLTRGLSVEMVFKRVRAAVYKDSKREQLPWETSSLIGDFCFMRDSRGQCG